MPLDHDDDHKLDASENIGVNTSTEPPIGAVIQRRLSRRRLDFREAVDALAGLQAGRSAAAVGDRRDQARRRTHRHLIHRLDGPR